jgi:hypothetical protein
MICPKCGNENASHIMFCMGCGARVERPPAGEPGDARSPANVAAGGTRRCVACGGGRVVPGAVGPAMGVRVYAEGQQADLPLAGAMACADCGHVALALADDARRYLAGMLGG